MLKLPLSTETLTLEANTYFSGIVHRGAVATSPDTTFKVFQVQFQPSARTFWHTHSKTQQLIVLEGDCLVKREGQKAIVLKEGQGISLPANERHWHGATPVGATTHLAINDDLSTDWLEAVSETDYQQAILESRQI